MKLAALTLLLVPAFAFAQLSAYESTCRYQDTGEVVGKFIHTTENGALKRLGAALIYPAATPQYAAVKMNGLALQFMWDRGDKYFYFSVAISPDGGGLFFNNSTGMPEPVALFDCSKPVLLSTEDAWSILNALTSSLQPERKCIEPQPAYSDIPPGYCVSSVP